jgi:hypothetical protein
VSPPRILAPRLACPTSQGSSFAQHAEDLPFWQVSAQKDELVLQFTESDVVKKKEEHLLEMRFFIPDTEEQPENEVAA